MRAGRDTFAEAPSGTLVNYPAIAGPPVAPGGRLVGACVRDQPGDPELDSLDRGGEPPRAYVALRRLLSARSDVLTRIAEGLRRAGFEAVIASGVTPPEELGPLPEEWIVPRVSQIAALRACDVVVCHGGNNTVMEALAAGLQVVALPFSTDQFAVAADLEAGGLGVALDPNRATALDLAAAMRLALGSGPRARASKLRGANFGATPAPSGPERILVGLAGRRSESGRTVFVVLCTAARTAAVLG